VHLIGYGQDGALLRELFTHDGVGTVVTRESLENIREAKPDDIAALIALIEPMEAEGILVHRPRELLEREIEHFSIMLHDGIIVGCAALYPHSEDEAELACLAVNPDHREWGYGEQLMERIIRRAKQAGMKRLFVLTTRTEHWFVERGFKLGKVDDLPANKRDMYNYQRRSKVLFKTL
jgi:amino-acid N-acetyltransferase